MQGIFIAKIQIYQNSFILILYFYVAIFKVHVFDFNRLLISGNGDTWSSIGTP